MTMRAKFNVIRPFRVFFCIAAILELTIFLAIPTPAYALFGRVDFSDSGDFSESAILSGVRATQEQCATAANSVWANTKDSGAECLKYWAAGFDSFPVKRAIV